MRISKFIFMTIGALMLLSSCEFEFDVRSHAKPGLYVQCMADEGSGQVFVKMQYAAPAQGNTNDIPALDIRSMKMTHRGKALDVIDRDSVFVASCPGGISSGDEIVLSVDAAGLPGVDASCTVPGGIALKGMTHGVDTLMNVPMHTLTLEFDRQMAGDEYLAVLLQRTTYFEGDSTRVDYLTPMVNFGSNMEIETAQIGFVSPFMKESRGVETRITVIPAAAAKGTDLILTSADFASVMPPMMTPGWMPGMPLPQAPVVVRREYHAEVWAVSESFYRYALASYKSKSDFMAMMGLAPANFAWSNIQGGFGVCAAMVPGGETTIEE